LATGIMHGASVRALKKPVIQLPVGNSMADSN